MKIVSWNVNGIRSWIKKPGTLEFVTRDDIDILCLNETRVDQSLVETLKPHFQAFPFHFWACSEKKGYAGNAVFSKHQPLSSRIGFSEVYDHVGRVISLEFPRFFLISVYFPNSGSKNEFVGTKREFDDNFRLYLKDLLDTGKELVFIGDLNIVQGPLDYFQPKGKKLVMDEIELESFQLFLDLGLVDTFRKLNPSLQKFTWFSNKFPSHRSNNRGWRIDYAFITKSAEGWVDDSLIHSDILGSDHTPIELILSIPAN
jgi:exodeoxyribonuclease-3